jgi:hypothetical protein
MAGLFGREIGCAMRNAGISDCLWLDLTAGDGAAAPNDDPDRQAWHFRCSPGLMAYYARVPHRWTGEPQACKPVRVVLHETSDGTYELLLENLERELPALGYLKSGDSEWKCGPVMLSALNTSGMNADLSRIGWSTAVMSSNDPNHIRDWAMSPELPERVRATSKWFLGITTMGCNVGGLLRLEAAQRDKWYDQVGSLLVNLPRYHDLHLSAIDRDASRWGYLVISPNKVRPGMDWRASTEKIMHGAFTKNGMTLRDAWWNSDRAEFVAICDYLFKRAAERGAA